MAPYTDALAGMGALGKGGHTPNESLQLDPMALAIKRAVILMYRLSGTADQKKIEWLSSSDGQPKRS